MNTADAWIPAPLGAVVNHQYRLDEVIGEGGMAIVMGATRLADGLPVAIKFVKQPHVDGERSARRLLREAHVAGQLRSPHAVTLLGTGQTSDDVPFIVMERLEGETVGAWLERGPFAPADACRLLSDVCCVLSEAHQLGLVHRDITPNNLVLCRGGGGLRIKVLDFGLAKSIDDYSADVTHQHHIVGSPAYMSPEQVTRGSVDGRSDIWSVGVLLQEMVTGAPPFIGPSAADVYAAIVSHPPKPIALPEIPTRMLNVVARCLRKHPDDRYATVEDLRRDLCRVVLDVEPAVSTGSPPSSDGPGSGDETAEVPLGPLPWRR